MIIQKGFSLLELLVATLISSIIGVALTAALRQATTIQRIVQNEASCVMRISLAERQLRRDIEGIFVPAAAMPKQKKVSVSTASQQVQIGNQKQQPIEKNDSKKNEEESVKPVKDFFLLAQKDAQFSLCTFITNNPILGYTEGPLGVIKARIVRVVYQLKKDPLQKNAYILYRQEGRDLELEKYTNAKDGALRPYELLGGIKSMSIECVTFEQTKEGPKIKKDATWKRDLQAQQDEKEKQKKPDSVAVKTSSDQKKTEEKKEPLIPDALLITLVLWDSQFVHENTFRFYMPIAGSHAEPEKSEPSAQNQNQKDQGQPQSNVSLQPGLLQGSQIGQGVMR